MDVESVEQSRPPDRRTFFKRVVNTLGAAMAAMLAAPLAGFYALPALRARRVLWREVGPVDDFAVGDIRLVPLTPLERREWPDSWGAEAAWVYRRSDQDFVIYNLHCTHVGCPVTWSPQARRFFSPCHGGVFDAEGRVLAGPPPRPLDRYETRIENGILLAGPVYRVSEQLERLDG